MDDRDCIRRGDWENLTATDLALRKDQAMKQNLSSTLRARNSSCIAMAFLLAAIIAPGCATMNLDPMNLGSMNLGSSLLPTRETPEQQPLAQSAGTYKVIFQSKSGRQPKIYEGKIVGNKTVQQALEESGATRKYSRMQVDLARVLPENGNVLRLPVTYDASHEAGHGRAGLFHPPRRRNPCSAQELGPV